MPQPFFARHDYCVPKAKTVTAHVFPAIIMSTGGVRELTEVDENAGFARRRIREPSGAAASPGWIFTNGR